MSAEAARQKGDEELADMLQQQATRLDEEVGHPFGITAIGIRAWEELNPLLKDIANKMDQAGFPTSEFTGQSQGD